MFSWEVVMKPKSSLKLRRRFSLALVFVMAISMLAVPGSAPAAATTQSYSYIVQGVSVNRVSQLVQKYGGSVTSQLEIIHAVGAVLSPAAVASLQAEPGVTAVIPNAQVQLTDNGKEEQEKEKDKNKDKNKGQDENGDKDRKNGAIPSTDYPDVIGADLVWGQGVNGSGVTVAIVDTGLAEHPGLIRDINGKTKARILGWKDFVDNSKHMLDPNGHGTHVAGIIANTQVGEDGEWDGVAPGVSLVGVRVLNDQGFGTYELVIQGIQWVIDHKAKYNIRVMNLSLVSPAQTPYWSDPLNQAVMQAWADGIVVVVAAGNGGPGPMTVGVPGNNPYVITVGAFTDNYTPNDWGDDYIAPFSAAGPTLDGFAKPDVVAPGAHMVSTMMRSSNILHNDLDNFIDPLYFSMAGTSQAAAVVSGLSALALSNNTNLTPDQVKFRVMYTAYPWVDLSTTESLYSIWQQGAGRVNAPDAVFASMEGQANTGMDILGDLAGTVHYEGYSYYDETTGQFRLRGDFSDWSGGYWAWDGGFGAWSGGFGAWSGGFGAWSGGFGAWSGGFGAWSGGFGAWSGGFGAWSGGFGAWSGGFGAWSGGFGAWSGSEPWAGTIYADPAFVQDYMAGKPLDASSTTTAIGEWVDEP
jgi:serine protease AprX